MTHLTRTTIDLARLGASDTTRDPPDHGRSFWRGVIVAIAFSVPAWGAVAAAIWWWP